jgi:hypothetical protein
MAHIIADNTEIFHYGVKGMHWGVRREEKAAQKNARRVAKGGELVRKAQSKGIKNPAAAIALRGAGEVGVILFTGTKISNAISNQNARNGAHIVKLALAGKVGATRIGEIRAVNAYNKQNAG